MLTEKEIEKIEEAWAHEFLPGWEEKMPSLISDWRTLKEENELLKKIYEAAKSSIDIAKGANTGLVHSTWIKLCFEDCIEKMKEYETKFNNKE